MTTYTVPPEIYSRPFESVEDWWQIRHLLIETHAVSGPEYNWEIRHWDGNRFHGADYAYDPARYKNFRVWVTRSNRVIGLAHTDWGELILNLHPSFRYAIEEEMVAYAEENLAAPGEDGRPRLNTTVWDYDVVRQGLLEKRGWQKTVHGWVNRRLHFGNAPIPEPVVAEGYTLRATTPCEADCRQMAALLNAAFNRDNFHQPEDTYAFMTQSPSFRDDLNLVTVAPDGTFAAHIGFTLDEVNRYGITEPVCTHPAHRRKGLAQALMFEGLRRLKNLGAESVQVSTGLEMEANKYYNTIGFTEMYVAHLWEKVC